MKKILAFILSVVALCCVFGCNNNENPDTESAKTANYTVEYYFENENGAYVKDEKFTAVKIGKINDTVTAPLLENLNGYVKFTHADSLESGVILSDGSLVLKVYYKAVKNNDNEKDENPSEPPSETANYTVEYYFGDENGVYAKDDKLTVIKSGKINETVIAPLLENLNGYEKFTHADSLESGVIVSDGSLVLKVYYKAVTCTVTFIINGNTVTKNVRKGTCVEAPAVENIDNVEYEWLCNGKEYNFSLPVYEDITITLSQWAPIVPI